MNYNDFLTVYRNFSEHTREAYSRDLRLLLQFCRRRGIEVLNLSAADLQEFSLWLAGLQFSAASRSRVISGVKCFFNYLSVTGAADVPADALRRPKSRRPLPAVLTLSEIESLKSAALRLKNGTRTAAMIEILYSCGLRVSELCNLKKSDFLKSEKCILITGKGGKSRRVPFSSSVVSALCDYFRCERCRYIKDSDYIFTTPYGAPLSQFDIYKAVTAPAAALRLEKKISPHTFRHSFATHLYDGGASLRAIQILLGHSSISSTEFYVNLSQTAINSEISAHPRFC